MMDKLYADIREKMEKTLQVLKTEFSGLRTGRASTALLEKVKVSCYNSILPLNQVASITVPDPHLIIVQPWDSNIVGEVEKGILSAGLGLVPNNDGKVIRISIPPLSEERREELTKVASKITEQARVSIRNIRREENDRVRKMEKEGNISEDDSKQAQEKIQDITNEFIKKLDELLKNKEKEIMEF